MIPARATACAASDRRIVPGVCAVAALLALLFVTPMSRAQLAMDELPDQARGVDIVEKLGDQIPDGITVRSWDGRVLDLRRDLFDGSKPAILTLVYYDCPLMCPLVLERMVETVEGIKYKVGEDFNLVVVSFDPTNTDQMAADARERAVTQYLLARSESGASELAQRGMLFHTASGGNARKLGDAIGYHYKQLPNGEYSHPAALVVLSPKGKVSRYLSINKPGDETVELALLKASQGAISTGAIDWFRHLCFSWDPSENAYALQAMRVMQLGAALTLVLLGGLIGTMLVRGRIGRASASSAGRGGDGAPHDGSTHADAHGRHATGYTA